MSATSFAFVGPRVPDDDVGRSLGGHDEAPVEDRVVEDDGVTRAVDRVGLAAEADRARLHPLGAGDLVEVGPAVEPLEGHLPDVTDGEVGVQRLLDDVGGPARVRRRQGELEGRAKACPQLEFVGVRPVGGGHLGARDPVGGHDVVGVFLLVDQLPGGGADEAVGRLHVTAAAGSEPRPADRDPPADGAAGLEERRGADVQDRGRAGGAHRVTWAPWSWTSPVHSAVSMARGGGSEEAMAPT